MAKNNNKTAPKHPEGAKQQSKQSSKNKQSVPGVEQLIIEPIAEKIDTTTNDVAEPIITDESTNEQIETISEELNGNDTTDNSVDNVSEEPIEAVSLENTESLEPVMGNIVPFTDGVSDKTISTEPIKNNRKPRLCTDITYKLVGCSYHYFRRFFKKQFNNTAIKVRFVKSGTGYNGYIEIAEASKEQSIALLEKIKTDNPTIKNIYWDLVSE